MSDTIALVNGRRSKLRGMNHENLTTNPYRALAARIEAGTARVGIIGLGYVGLPLARAFADKGFPVLGFDIDPAKVAALQRGETYIAHIPAETVRAMRAQSFEATDRFERLDEPD